VRRLAPTWPSWPTRSTHPGGEWNSERILAEVKALAESRGAKLGDLLQPVRVVLTGSTVSEPVNDLLVVVGREESLARIHAGTRA